MYGRSGIEYLFAAATPRQEEEDDDDEVGRDWDVNDDTCTSFRYIFVSKRRYKKGDGSYANR